MSIQTLQPAFATFRRHRSAASPALAVSAPRVEVLRTVAAVEAIAAEWRVLEASTPEATGFQSADWCMAWMRAGDARDDRRWRVVTVRDGGCLVSLWPLERDRFVGARVLHWMGEPWTQYGDALVAAGPCRMTHLAAAWREISAWTDVDLVKLGRVRADAALYALPGFNDRTVTHEEKAPFIDLRRTMSRPLDKRLRARRRKLEEIGTVAFDVVVENHDRVACVQKAVAMKRAWLDARGLTSSGLYHRDLEGLMEALVSGGALVIGRLRVGQETAALELGLRCNGHFRSLLGCHDDRFAQGSPGHLLIGHMVDWCRANGFVAYDLMVPDDAYKRRWASDETAVCDHLIATRSRGHLAAAWFRARPVLKSAYAHLPARIRRVLKTGLRQSA